LGGLPLLAVVRRPDGSLLGIASSNDKDAATGPDWGRGADSPVLRGVMKQAPRMQLVAMEAVAKLSAGNGWFVEVGPKLDGPLKGFGGRFWKLLAGKAPFLVAAMQTSGVKTLRYCDRYLLSPAALGMLAETVSACPGLRDGAITIDIAGGDGNARAHWRIQDNFPSDGMRTQTLRSLLQSASVQLHSDRRDLDHYRSFKLLLRDDREVTIYLDQGFGAWQINASPRHDFGASADRQAEAIRTTRVDVKAFSETGSPVYVTMSDAQA
jgi:DEAD/DEAH box helicase domain-containing protein